MTKKAFNIEFINFEIDKDSEELLWMQVYNGIRKLIISGEISPGDQLLSTRAMAARFGISRVTVSNAYEQLHIEGYLTGSSGSGTYVSENVPDNILQILTSDSVKTQKKEVEPAEYKSHGSFARGIPDVYEFPFGKWGKIAAHTMKNMPLSAFNESNTQGHKNLRLQISHYLKVSRGIQTSHQNIIITSSVKHSLSLIFAEILQEGDVVWIEEPGFENAKSLFEKYKVKIVPIPVDKDGIDLKPYYGQKLPKFIYVTPSHQYPLGYTLSLRRRLELIKLAKSCGALILEDDYDSEFRYFGKPIRALHGLDQSESTIYLGNFNKILFHGLRISFLVAPLDLVNKLLIHKEIDSRGNPIYDQAILSEFMQLGYLNQHIRKMRIHYLNKYTILRDAISEHLIEYLDIITTNTGIQFVCALNQNIDDVLFVKYANSYGFDFKPLSITYFNSDKAISGLILGLGTVRINFIEREIIKLKEVFEEYLKRT
jgi:GntR family transcriptional regulator / MocR family aminotransferase